MFECVIKCIELNNHYHFPRFTLIYLLSKIDIYILIKYLNTHLLRTGLITHVPLYTNNQSYGLKINNTEKLAEACTCFVSMEVVTPMQDTNNQSFLQ